MKQKQILKLFAILLILLTFQKSMGNLLFHELAHHNSEQKENSKDAASIQMHCHCFDDFIAPSFVLVDTVEINPTIIYLNKRTQTCMIVHIQRKIVASSLRGPPSYLS